MSILIHDGNAADFVQDGAGFVERTVPIGCYDALPCYADEFALIPDAEWVDRAKAMDEAKAYVRDRYLAQNPVHQYQNGMNFCWAFSLAQAKEMARAVAGLPYVQLAPESLGSLVGWSNSGYNCGNALAYDEEHGMAPRSFVPQFSLDYRHYKAGWQEEALKYRVVEKYDLGKVDMWREVVSAVLSGFAVYTGYNRFRHALSIDSLEIVSNELCPSLPNTWQLKDRWVLTGRSKVPDEAYAIRTVIFSGA